jgi:hypothetical protein
MDQLASVEPIQSRQTRYGWQLFRAFSFAAVSILFFAYAVCDPMRGGHSYWEYLQKAACRHTEIIATAMYNYSQDHGGQYPTGKSSIEVFQKLIDGHYINDPKVFFAYGALYSDLPHRSGAPADSNILRSENVRFDVTIPLNAQSPNGIPIVFLTGCKVTYQPGASAIAATSNPFRGLSVIYTAKIPTPNWLTFLYNEPQIQLLRFIPTDPFPERSCYISNFISPDFKPDGIKYVQLTPDGPWAQ